MDWIDYFKLRVSYGEVGNQAIGSYSTLARLQEYNYLRGDNAETTAAGYGPGALANNNLRWETTVKLNYGFDFQIINSRISGAIDIYETHTHDLLLDRSISSIHGVTENFAAGWQAGAFTSITSNIGEVKNTGFDLSISSKNIQSPKFLWETKLSVSHNKNQIIDLYGNKEDDIANKWFIGKSIDTNFDYVFDGVWQIGDDYSLQPEAEPGIVKIKDTNNDGKIDADDRSFIGHSDPSYIIGFENTISYQNFTLSMFFNSQLGATKYNQLMETDIVEVDCRRNTVKQNWWREDNPTNDYPRNSNYSNPYAIKFYQNASFLRLRDVTLSYVFSDQTIKKIGVKNLRIYGNITNALTFTKWEGLDPELGSQIANPLNRTFSIGLNIGI